MLAQIAYNKEIDEDEMKIYDLKAGLNTRRVRIFLAEKGIEVPRVEVDMAAGENQRPEYLAKNPMGTMPLLELDDGTMIAESIAICRYFEILHPDPPLFGVGALGQARVEMWKAHGDRTHATSCGPFHSPVAVLERPTGTDCPGRACRARASGSPYALARRRIVRPGFHCR